MTKHEELEKQIDQAARRFAETHDEKHKQDVERLSWQLADICHLEALEAGLVAAG